ncbi:hypothetical protein U6G28_05425 [Actinomycetaceae bacterium MB13-C1-2]|nr:hypothetical protein U6G28_05425 [Actinomycetaceae bacterium MB13-C1-2]
MTAKLAPRHRGSEKAITPITGTFGSLGKRSVAVASATGVALTAVVASTAAATAPTVLPQAPSGDFVSNLESTDTATLVSLDMDWDSGDTVSVKAEEPAPVVEPEAPQVEETTQVANRSDNRSSETATVVEQTPSVDIPAGAGGAGIAAAALAQVGEFQDCTAVVERALRAIGVPAGDQGTSVWEYVALGGTQVYGEMAVGDILIWPGQHVAVYIGGGQAVHGGWNGSNTVVWSAYYQGGPGAVVRF